MTLSGPTNATLKSDANTATATINDDDALPQLSIAGATVDEGDTAQFVVTLAPASGKQVTVSLFDDGRRHGQGVGGLHGGLEHDADVHCRGRHHEDGLGGDDRRHAGTKATEAFTMTLSGPTNATLKSDAKTATGTINDDDALPVLSIADATAVAEGEAAQFVVTLAPASSKQVTVSYATADGTAKASEGLHGGLERDADVCA